MAEDSKRTERSGRVAEATKTRLSGIEARREKEPLTKGELRADDEDFRALLDRIPIGVYRTTPDGKILLANATLVRMLGCRSFLELADRNLQGAVYEPEYTREWFNREIQKDNEIRGLEATWTLADGTQLRVRENARAVLARDGALLYYEGTVEDIGEHKESEELLRAKADFLEEVVTTPPSASSSSTRTTATSSSTRSAAA